nr:synaptotagmin-9-like [Biomphalaria glabrata]
MTRQRRDEESRIIFGAPASNWNSGVNFENAQPQDQPTEVKSDDGLWAYISPLTLAIVSACIVTLIVLCVVALVWFKVRRRRQKLLRDLTFDEGSEESKSTKSAPTSRTPSPKLNKRMSCPDALTLKTACAKEMLARSLTSDRIPDFMLPPERVQPYSPHEKKTQSFNFSTHQMSAAALGSIKPDLYHHQSFSEDDEPNLPETKDGRLWFSMVYDATVEQLHVTLIKVKDLPGRSNSSLPRDPFVKIYLLPDERTCRVSKVKKKTLSPVFNETHTFLVGPEEIKKRVLRFSVYDVDRRRVRHSLGHVMINLKGLDLTKGDVMWSDLEPMAQATSSLGELQFSLVYIPANEKIKIGIHRAKNLNQMEDYPDTGAYVKVQLYYGHKCHRVKRTIPRPGGTEIMFNESLSFTVNGKQMDSCNMVVSIMLTSAKAFGSNDVEYGRIAIGAFMYSRGEELVHWQEMISQPKIISTRWHSLSSVHPPP